MTGAEVIIVKDNEGVLGKVRCEGYQVLEFLQTNVVAHTGTPADLWKNVMAARTAVVAKDDEIETQFTKGFPFKVSPPSLLDFNALMEQAEDQMQSILGHDDDGYFCGYSDIICIVDLAKDGLERFVEGFEEDDDD